MNKIKNIFLIIFFSVGWGAAESTVTDLNSCVNFALRYSPIARQLERSREIARSQYRQAPGYFLPSMIDFSWVIEKNSLLDDYSTQSLLNIGYQLPFVLFSGNLGMYSDGMKSAFLTAEIRQTDVWLNYLQRDVDWQRAENEYYLGRKNLIIDVINQYFQVIQAAKQIEINRRAVTQAEKYLEAEKTNLRAGNRTKHDVLRAEVQLANIRANLAEAEDSYNLARMNLNVLIGLPVNSSGDLDASLDIPPFPRTEQDCIKFALLHRQDIKLFERQRDLSRQRLLLLKLRRYPYPVIEGYYNWFSSLNSSSADNWILRGTLRFPLFDRGILKEQIKQEELNLTTMEEQLANAREKVVIEVKQAYFALQRSRRKIDVLLKAIEEARERLRIEELRFQMLGASKSDDEFIKKLRERLGRLVTIDQSADLFSAQNNLIQVEADYYQAVSDYYLNKQKLERIIGEYGW